MTDVSIYSEAFHKLREDFDKMMISTLARMQEKGSKDATITLKIDIGLEKTFAPVSGTTQMRDVYLPTFEHKITSAMQIKQEVKGRYDEECELVWNPASNSYLLVPIGQLMLSDEIERTEEDEDDE